MAEGGVNIEMDGYGEGREREDGTEETSFIDDNRDPKLDYPVSDLLST